MANPIKYSHEWPDLVAANRGVFRFLHVEQAITGVVVPLPTDATFDNLTVNNSLSIGGPTVSTAPITTSDDIFCRNLTASQTVTGNALVGSTLTATTVTNNPTFAAGATIAPAQTLTITDAAIFGAGAAAITVNGSLTSLAGAVVAPVGTITTMSNNTTFAVGATIAPAQTLTVDNATISGAGTASMTLQGNISSTTGSLSAPTATLPAINGVITINGAPYPPSATFVAAGGPQIDVANGLVFPTMTIPAGGTGAYRVTDASLAGMANNAADPGVGNGGPAAAGLAFITGFAGDIAGRTELLLYNVSSNALTFAAPIVSTSATRGRVWWPGARARATRSDAITATWVVEVDDMRFNSTMLTDATAINTRAVLPAGTTLVSAGLEYSLRGYSDAATDDAIVVIEGVLSVALDRTGNPAPATADIDVTVPVFLGASSSWSALPGFLPSFGTLDNVEADKSQGAYELESRRVVGAATVYNVTGATAWCGINSDSTFALFLRLFGIGTQTNVIATGAFRFVGNRYTYVATF